MKVCATIKVYYDLSETWLGKVYSFTPSKLCELEGIAIENNARLAFDLLATHPYTVNVTEDK